MTRQLITELRQERDRLQRSLDALDVVLALANPADGGTPAPPRLTPAKVNGKPARTKAVPVTEKKLHGHTGEARILVLEILTGLDAGEGMTTPDIVTKCLSKRIKLPQSKVPRAVTNALYALKVSGQVRREGERWSLA